MMEQGDTTLSFDIFDTVLTRVWFKPVDLFTAVGRELAIEGLVADASSWAEAREVVESELRRALAHTEGGGSEEVSLIAVHNALAIRLGINQESHERALKIELDLERGAMRSIAATRAVIAAAQDAGQTVIFLSDTYFEQDFIIDILYRTGVKPAPNTVYTSLALGYTKRTGSLFSHVLAERGIAPSTLHHVGDNLHSDVVSPRKLGIESRHFVMQKPTRYEKHYYAVSFATPRLLRAAVAGAARTARLGSHESNRHRQVIAETSADVAGPMLTGFVLWVLVEAKRRGRTRLYFLARDGQILLQIAKRLTAWLGWDMELRYLYASRQALFLPSITALDEATLGWLTEKAADVTLAAILSRVEFDPHAETVLLIEAGFPPENWDRPLGSDGVKRLEQLLQQPSFVARIIAQASARRAVLLDYLTDEGMIDGVPFAIVDIGWKGRLQLCLGKILASRPGGNQTPLMGFYFGLVRRPDPRIAGELFTYVNTRLPHSALLETFVKADHGTVRGFCRSPADKAVPELAEAEDSEALAWGLGVQQATIIAFVDLMLSVLKPSDASPDVLVIYLRDCSMAAFNMFWRFPTSDEAAAYGSMRHAIDQTHHDPVDIAPILPLSQLVALLTQSRAENERQTSWVEGSIARATNPSRLQRTLLLSLRDVRRRAWAVLSYASVLRPRMLSPKA